MPQPLGDRFSVRRRVATIVTLGLLTGLGPFTIDLYLPTFPTLKADLAITIVPTLPVAIISGITLLAI